MKHRLNSIPSKKLLILALILISIPAWIQSESASNRERNKINPRWALETSPVFAVIGIYPLQLNYRVWEKGELLFGPCFQHQKSDNGRFKGYSLALGYRQYFWRDLHGEFEFYPAYNPFRSSIDNEIYKGWDGFCELRVGYTLRFRIGTLHLFIPLQIGAGYPVFRTNPWPQEKSEKKLMFIPNIGLGIVL